MVRLNGNQMRKKLDSSIRRYCQNNHSETKKKAQTNGKVS